MLKRFLFSAALSLGAALAGLTGCRSHSGPPPAPPPAWTLSPKPADSVYCYFVGTSTGQSAPAAAREAAYQDALRQISRHIVSEAGLGLAALPPGGILLPLEGAEIMPGCFYQRRLPGVCAGEFPDRREAQSYRTAAPAVRGSK